MRSYERRDGLMLAGGLGLGAALMFFLDPRGGRGRRSGALRAVAHSVGVAGKAARGSARVVRHGGGRVAARIGSSRAGTQPSDEAIAARVRAVLARSVSFPRSITVAVERGNVVLGGPVIAREVEGLLSRLRKVRGVRGVRSRMDAHDWAADVPGLQGAAERPRRKRGRELLEGGWPTRITLVGGAALGALALRRARSLR